MDHFNIIRFRGDRQTATIKMRNGAYAEVKRIERMHIDSYGEVIFAPYQDHFIFKTPDVYSVGPAFMCTCGTDAIIVGAKQYSSILHDASPGGYMMCCRHHMHFGKHAA